MRKCRRIILIQLLLAVFFLVGCTGAGTESTDSAVNTEVRSFADWTDCKVFQDIPVMRVSGTRIGEAVDYGAGTYIINVNGTSLEDYQSYLQVLEADGFVKYVDNGAEGLDGCVYSSTYTKEELVLTITHIVKTRITYIAASDKMNLSENLFYSDENIADNTADAKTKLHMQELYAYGDSYIIQMKNGHFIMIDGGMQQDTLYLLDYLETLVPEGEKPVIEAWFVTHGHGDHIGAFYTFVSEPKNAERIYVEGVYFSEPSAKVCSVVSDKVQNVKYGSMAFKTSRGQTTKIYRPQTGQRYYFNDITIDILHTQEQLPSESWVYANDFNETSTLLLFTIEGQKFLDAGDASESTINVVKRTYNQEYFKLDLLSVPHHGQNVYTSYIDWFDYKVLIYPTFLVGSQTSNWKQVENKRLQARAEECMSWGDGAKILTFPYEIGTAKSLPMRDWIYHPDRKTPEPY